MPWTTTCRSRPLRGARGAVLAALLLFLAGGTPAPAPAQDDSRPALEGSGLGPGSRVPEAVLRALAVAAGYVAEASSLEDDGEVLGSATEGDVAERSLSVFDVVYVPPSFDGAPAAVGDSLLVYEEKGDLRHPQTRETLGRIVAPTGLAVLTGVEGDVASAVLIEAFHPVQAGQRVQRLRRGPGLLPAGERGAGEGRVVGFRERGGIVEPFAVLYLDLPPGGGLAPGADVLLVRAEEEEGRELPEVEIGRARVLDVGGSAATALVTALDRSDLRVGDAYRSLP